jgi:hypothetical protein
MFPGVNGMLNALLYYGNNVEFHYLYMGKPAEEFANEVYESNFYTPGFIAVNINSLKEMDEFPIHPKPAENVWYCKMYRYLYAIHVLNDYDAVAIFDADMQIVNKIMPFFGLAESSGKLLLPNNDYSNQEFDDCNADGIRGAASPPLHNMPSFFKPSEWFDTMSLIPGISLELTLGDMSSMSHALLRTGRMPEIVAMPNAQWVISHYYNIKLFHRVIGGKRYLALHRNGDRIYTFHRKWWYSSVCKKFIEDVKEKEAQEIAYNNVRLFWEMTMFFNFNCEHKIKWSDKWGQWPDQIKMMK